ncbi:BON domain-containing protein [Micromonospora sp. WMMD882]|uniref:BON domain-containing protein n=1 Tax=Micromonospora sp. WMMD882 TaxID=3015151 RepID=UPI00248D0583|nr:BON domain-containing protein [Micromonospora sp. WMMD882]WBB80217.1 BON domain-containing protein [Micromonospora sp. WMMD882]
MFYPWFSAGDVPVFPPRSGDPDTVLAYRLLDQMRQDPLLRYERICIEAQNGVIILEGEVSSAERRAEAHAHAWRAPGVRDVNNRLRQRRGRTA